MPVCPGIDWSDGSHQEGQTHRRQEDDRGRSPTRGRLGLDDRRQLFPRHHLHPGSDQVMILTQTNPLFFEMVEYWMTEVWG